MTDEEKKAAAIAAKKAENARLEGAVLDGQIDAGNDRRLTEDLADALELDLAHGSVSVHLTAPKVRPRTSCR